MIEDNEYILWFNQISKNDIPKVGGKGANLGEMTKANFPVPPGFVVTAQAYWDFLDYVGIREKVIEIIDSIDVDNTQELEEKSKQIRELIKSKQVPEELATMIMKAYSKLGQEKLAWLTSTQNAYVAVRSSATAEDLPEASFAGQQETYLNVVGKENVVNHVKKCWASLFTARAVYYRKKNNFPTDKVALATVVQKMVKSEKSGVMFTSDPTGKPDIIVVEACFGLGEAIVSGSITPDTFTIDKKNLKIIDKRIGKQEWKLVRQAGANVKIKLNSTEGKKQKITKEKVVEIARIGKRIEQHYGKPQDIEWAIEENELYIVQSRPITTLNSSKNFSQETEHETNATVLLTGLPASPGTGSGKVIVLKEANEINDFIEGSVLVTEMTNPDWVPVMKKSAGIITDDGGTTCHAAIVSRELGIPCIVGSENATKILKNNQIVTVNGFNGQVYDGEIKFKKHEEEKPVEIFSRQEVDEIEKVIEHGNELKQSISEIKEKTSEEEIEEKELKERAEEEVRELILSDEKKAKEIVKDYGKINAEKMNEEDFNKEKKRLIELLGNVTAKVKVNVALPEAAENAAKTNAAGVGLLRAEHMITQSGIHPAHYIRMGKDSELISTVKEGIKFVAEKFKGKPVWFRTFDARTDEFRSLQGGEDEPKEENPMLGWHGIRRDFDTPDMLRAQLNAIKQLREEGITNVGVMLPFVTHTKQVIEFKKIAKEVGLELGKEKTEFGVMIETPASVWIIDELIAEGINFISFGTNDLTQLTLGIDRNNEKIQSLFSELHPAVLGEIKMVIKACKQAGVTTSICGQAASNPEMVKKLIRFGIDSVSANIDAVEKIRETVLLEEKNLILEHFHLKD